MTSRLTDLFNKSESLGSFEELVIELDGDFDFNRDEMLLLGESYFRRFPDREKNRNSDEVRLGYRIARVCINENLIRGLPVNEKASLRKGFKNLACLGDTLNELKRNRNREECLSLLDLLNARIEAIHATVNTLPKGMIRERFTGALSTSSNFLYLIRLLLEKEGAGI